MEKEKVIYTITSLYLIEDCDETQRRLEYRNRCVGFYFDYNTAEQCVQEDWAGFDEAGYYNYIVIEGLHQGIYPGLGDDEHWFKYNGGHNWIPCEKPRCLNGTISFGIG